jgi:hypothetical protein
MILFCLSKSHQVRGTGVLLVIIWQVKQLRRFEFSKRVDSSCEGRPNASVMNNLFVRTSEKRSRCTEYSVHVVTEYQLLRSTEYE